MALRELAVKWPGVYLHKAYSSGDRALFEMLVQSGNKVAAIDEEQLVDIHPDHIGNEFLSEDTLNLVDRIFLKDSASWNTLVGKFPAIRAKATISGNPRATVLGPEYQQFRQASIPRQLPKTSFILFLTSFASVNFSESYGFSAREQLLGLLGDATTGSVPKTKLIAEFDGFQYAEQELLKQYLSSIRYLSQRFPRRKFVVRPHPSESIRFWRKEIGHIPNVLVTRSGPSHVWAEASSLTVHPGSTAGYEARLLGSKSVLFGNKQWPETYTSLYGNAVLHASDLEALIELPQSPDGVMHSQQETEISLDSAEIISEGIQELGSKVGKHTTGLLHRLEVRAISLRSDLTYFALWAIDSVRLGLGLRGNGLGLSWSKGGSIRGRTVRKKLSHVRSELAASPSRVVSTSLSLRVVCFETR